MRRLSEHCSVVVCVVEEKLLKWNKWWNKVFALCWLHFIVCLCWILLLCNTVVPPESFCWFGELRWSGNSSWKQYSCVGDKKENGTILKYHLKPVLQNFNSSKIQTEQLSLVAEKHLTKTIWTLTRVMGSCTLSTTSWQFPKRKNTGNGGVRMSWSSWPDNCYSAMSAVHSHPEMTTKHVRASKRTATDLTRTDLAHMGEAADETFLGGTFLTKLFPSAGMWISCLLNQAETNASE